MSRKSRDLKRLVIEMEYWVDNHPDLTTRQLINHWLNLAKSAETDIDIIIEEAQNMGIRNSAFPGD